LMQVRRRIVFQLTIGLVCHPASKAIIVDWATIPCDFPQQSKGIAGRPVQHRPGRMSTNARYRLDGSPVDRRVPHALFESQGQDM
jgi:hypothetical protein